MNKFDGYYYHRTCLLCKREFTSVYKKGDFCEACIINRPEEVGKLKEGVEASFKSVRKEV